MDVSGGSDASCHPHQESQLVTPYYTPSQKQIFQKSDLKPVNMEDLFFDSFGDSSVTSLKESPRSPSSSSSLSEPEYVIDSFDKEDNNNMVWEEADKSYDELFKKFTENEEELRATKFNLQLSKEEIVKLKIQIEKSEGQLDYVSKELKLKVDDLEHERGQVVELQKQTAEILETHVPDCCYKIAKLVEQLEVANENLKISNDENERLRKEIVSRSSETHQLQSQIEVAQKNVAKLECELDTGRKQIQGFENLITWYEADQTTLFLEVNKLKDEILDAQEVFSLEKDQLQSDIAGLSEMKIQLTSKLEEWESKNNALENIIRKYEAENLKQEELRATQQMVLQDEITSLKKELSEEKHVVETSNKQIELLDTQQMVLQDEISSLKEEVSERKHYVEAVNKELEKHKQKFDILVIERDEANAEIDKLKAEIVEVFEQHTKQVKNLTLKVDELGKEIIRLHAIISERDEEKREAIRQLCFSLEHYRSGYQEVLRAFVGLGHSHKHRAVIITS